MQENLERKEDIKVVRLGIVSREDIGTPRRCLINQIDPRVDKWEGFQGILTDRGCTRHRSLDIAGIH